jgi:transcriptional regulator with XRE-family HTH domain
MAKDKKTTIGARMRAAREAAGLSQGQVARKLKMHRPTISEIEAGRRTLSAEELPVFAKLYGVETWWLACAEPEEGIDAEMAKYHLAARHLSKMKQTDFDRLMDLIEMVRAPKGNE